MHLSPPAQVISRVFDSTLFDHLDSTWDFKPGPTPESTWLSFTVDFAFKSPLYHHIASVFFDEVRPWLCPCFTFSVCPHYAIACSLCLPLVCSIACQIGWVESYDCMACCPLRL